MTICAANRYALLDSGAGEKLEQFGERLIRRPSKLAIWKRRLAPQVWNNADAAFLHKSGWSFGRGGTFETWRCEIAGATLQLRLQQNGQVGLFPEHAQYMELFQDILRRDDSSVLNLFAYTGLASIVCGSLGATVSHVDLSKSANTWAAQNIQLNSIKEGAISLYSDDVTKFTKRAAARDQRYDLIILDPPSFSRPTKTQEWQLESFLPHLLNDLLPLLKDSSHIFLTSHLYECGAETMANICYDVLPSEWSITTQNLCISEKDSPRKLAAGFLVRAYR